MAVLYGKKRKDIFQAEVCDEYSLIYKKKLKLSAFVDMKEATLGSRNLRK